jgi:hypothetical protein
VADAFDGRFVITWVRYSQPPSDREQYQYNPIVMAQVFNADNTPMTGQFIVPSYADKTSICPDVAMNWDGSFIITWCGPDVDYGIGVQARRFDASGNPIGDQFRVNALANAYYRTPAISVKQGIADGGFMIVWTQYYNVSINPGHYDVYGQRFNASGAKVGATNFLISTDQSYQKMNPDIDMSDGGGNVFVVWEGVKSGAPDVFGQRLNSTGGLVGGEFQINTSESSMLNEDLNPRVSVAANGLTVVSYQLFAAAGASGFNVYARRYNASGAAQGNDFRVSQYTGGGYRRWSEPACDRDGNFSICWHSLGQDDPITRDYGIMGRTYNAAGTAMTDEYCINNYQLAHRGIDFQMYPAMTRRCSSGQWVCSWNGYQGIAPSGGILGVWRSQVVNVNDIRRQPLPVLWWAMTAPISGTYNVGSNISISWIVTGAQPGYTVCLCYASQPNLSGEEHWITVGEIQAVNGVATWNWNTTGATPGTWYIGGYVWNGSAPTYAFAATSFILQ